jgi:hypothetical protein
MPRAMANMTIVGTAQVGANDTKFDAPRHRLGRGERHEPRLRKESQWTR